MLASSLSVVTAGPASAERKTTTPTGWEWHAGDHVTPAFLTERIDRANLRIVDLEVRTASPLTFTAVLVKNTGVHAKTWWWFTGVSAKFIKARMKRLGARILDLENYLSGGKRRYAVVLIKRAGKDSKPTPWWLNLSRPAIKKRIEDHSYRILDINRKPNGRYDVVFIKNTGGDKTKWWYWYRLTPGAVNKKLKAKKARLWDIERDGNGRFTVVMVARAKGIYARWFRDRTVAQLVELANQNGARIIDVERYPTGGKIRYAAVMINNVNALTTKCREILRKAAKTAAYGCYLKRVNGSVLAALQRNKVFEPASTIKVLHHLTAMRQVESGARSVEDQVPWNAHPDSPARYPADDGYTDDRTVCAYDNDGTPVGGAEYRDELGPVILRQMMQRSDNRTTDAVYDLVGKDAINATAGVVGMTSTQLHHRIGCPSKASEEPFRWNELTLRDVGLLYERVAKGHFLSPGNRALFYDYMSSNLNRFHAVADKEAAKLGLPAWKVNQFKDQMRGAFKPGSYTNGSGDCNDDGCTHLLVRRSSAGWIELPFKVDGVVKPRGYVYGNFVDGKLKCPGRHSDDDPTCDPLIDAIQAARGKAFDETLRHQIRAALKSW